MSEEHRLVEEVDRWEEKMQPLIEVSQSSERLTQEDLEIRVTGVRDRN